MATYVPMARVPFAPLDNPRLQHLASLKNRQNGMLAPKSAIQGKTGITKSVLAPKRPFESTHLDGADGENIDPTSLTSPSKKSKSDVFGNTSPNTFTFTLAPAQSMPAPALPPLRASTPARPRLVTSPRAPSTAPAGRSPKRKTANGRRISAPFSRVDPPPSFGARGASSLPFSLDAAIHGSLSTSNSARSPASSTLQESMPNSWFFDVYEDSLEESAANFMEHSTSILDLSSDEESTQKELNHVGKENMPPEDYDGPTASRSAVDAGIAPSTTKKTEMIRKKILTADEMDDGQRSPLSDLETDPFIPVGLSQDSHFVVDEKPPTKLDLQDLFAKPVPFTSGTTKHTAAEKLDCPPDVDASGDGKCEIVVWEDDASVLTAVATEVASPAQHVPFDSSDASADSSEKENDNA